MTLALVADVVHVGRFCLASALLAPGAVLADAGGDARYLGIAAIVGAVFAGVVALIGAVADAVVKLRRHAAGEPTDAEVARVEAYQRRRTGAEP